MRCDGARVLAGPAFLYIDRMDWNTQMHALDPVESSPPDELQALSARLRTALALYTDGVAMQRAQLRRRHPTASEEQISMLLATWLHTRPGAAFGDAEGIGRVASR